MATPATSTALIRVVDGQIEAGTEFRLALNDLKTRIEKITSITDKDQCEEAKILVKKGSDIIRSITAAAEPERLRLQGMLETLRQERDALTGAFASLTGPLDRKVRDWQLAEQQAARAEEAKLNKGKRVADRVEVKPDIPRVAGTRFQPRYRFEIVDVSKVKREFMTPDGVKIGQQMRSDQDPAKTEKTVGGIKVRVE